MPVGGEDLGSAVLELVTDPTKLRQGMVAARQETLATVKSAQQALTQAGAKMTATGGQMTRGITLPVIAAGAAIVGVGGEFDHTLSKIVGLVGINREQINAWRPEIEALAKSTGIGPGELAKGLYFVASSGIEASKAMGVLTIAAKGSEAGMGDVEMLADVLTGTMNAYAKSNLTAAHAMDVLVRGIQVGKAEPAAFASAMGTVAPIAAQLNVTAEDLVGTLAILSRVNSNTAENATSLGQVLNTLLKPTNQTSEALAKMHLSAEGLRDELSKKGLLAVLKTLGEHIGTDDEAIAQIFPNIRALRGVLNLTGQDAGNVAEAMAKVGDATGALDDAVTAVADDASVKMNKALASMQVELIVLSSDVLPMVVSMLAGVVSGVHDAVTWFTALPAPVKSTVVQALGLLAILGPVLVILGSLVSATGNVIGGFRAMSTFMSATLIPRLTAFLALLATNAIQAFASALFASGIPALERLAVSLVGVQVAGGPLLLIAAAIAAIAVAASQGSPDVDELRAKLAELDADHGWGRNQKLIDALRQKIEELDAATAKASDDMRQSWDDVRAAIEATGIPQAVASVVNKIGAEVQSGRYVIKNGALVMAEGLPDAVTTKGRAAVKAVTKSVADMARAIRDSRQVIVDAMNQVVSDAYDPLILAAEITATKVELAEQRKILASKKSTPAMKREAELQILQLKKQLATQLNEQTQYGTNAQILAKLQGRATSKELVAGLKSGDVARKLASQAAAKDIASGMIELMGKTKNYGLRTGNAYIDGLIQAELDRLADIKRVHQKVANLFVANSPPGPESPLHDIDKWGWRTGEAYIRPLAASLAAGAAYVRRSLGGLAGEMQAAGPGSGTGALGRIEAMGAIRVIHTIDAESAQAFAAAGYDARQVGQALAEGADASGLFSNLRNLQAMTSG